MTDDLLARHGSARNLARGARDGGVGAQGVALERGADHRGLRPAGAAQSKVCMVLRRAAHRRAHGGRAMTGALPPGFNPLAGTGLDDSTRLADLAPCTPPIRLLRTLATLRQQAASAAPTAHLTAVGRRGWHPRLKSLARRQPDFPIAAVLAARNASLWEDRPTRPWPASVRSCAARLRRGLRAILAMLGGSRARQVVRRFFPSLSPARSTTRKSPANLSSTEANAATGGDKR